MCVYRKLYICYFLVVEPFYYGTTGLRKSGGGGVGGSEKVGGLSQSLEIEVKETKSRSNSTREHDDMTDAFQQNGQRVSWHFGIQV